MPQRPASPSQVPETVPIFPLTGALLLPFSHRPLNIFEPRYLAMVDFALANDRLIGLVQPEDTSAESPVGNVPLQRTGCLGRITHFEESGDGRYFIILEGVTRFHLVREIDSGEAFRVAEISAVGFDHDFHRNEGESDVDRSRLLKMMRDYAEHASIELDWEEIEQTGTADLVNFCAMVAPFGPAEKQLLLEAPTLVERAETLIAMTEYEIARNGADSVPLN